MAPSSRLDDDAVLAGIGMNVRHHPPGMPYPVTSLAALGCDTTPESVLAAIQRALQGEWTIWRDHGFARMRERWLERGPAIGTILRVQLGPDTIEGAFAGLRDDGALLLQTPTGRRACNRSSLATCSRSSPVTCSLAPRRPTWPKPAHAEATRDSLPGR
jgi:biotin-(acetyl-CoA carboxylase) ligase